MTCFGTCRRTMVMTVVAVFSVAAAPVAAGPWSELPDAVARLIDGREDPRAAAVLRQVEASVVDEAEQGRVVAARRLFDTYASLVSELPDGMSRLEGVERRMASALLEVGDRVVRDDLARAVAAWALAAELRPDSDGVARLQRVLLPPQEAEPGAIWRSPLDGAQLVFHPAMAIRLGCTDGDGACRDNEVIFRWIEVPAIWVEAEEVTNRRYRLCVEAGACTPPADAPAYRDLERSRAPVVGVTWGQARSFARWAGRRLPSEAEWERAARGEVTGARFPWGGGRRKELANVWQEPRTGAALGVRRVGSFPPTGYGLRDIAGNVWEWCQDRYGPRFSDASLTGDAARAGFGRVVRGGSWRRAIDMARVSSRTWYDVDYSADDLGFRCIMSAVSQITSDGLVRTANRAFPIRSTPGRELDGAALESEDRRFLDRRAITLYVVEGRLGEALMPAAVRLATEPSDPVALDVFDRFEESLLQAAAGDGLDEIEDGLAAFRRAVAAEHRLAPRLDRFERQLVNRLRRTVSASRTRGSDAVAISAARVGLSLVPGDAIFAAAVAALERTTGVVTVWSRDGKGMVWVEAQSFTIGASEGDSTALPDELPRVEVTVPGFWIDRTEVTNDEYRSCVRAGACTPPHRTEQFDDPRFGTHPVFWVDWFQARSYAQWAGKRLPSEAQWELAARAGTTTPFYWGSSWVPGEANAMGAYRRDVWGGSAPVASFEANRWGVYDLIGNASEWVDDVYQDTLTGVPTDGRPRYQETGPAGERRRVVRGGGHDDSPPRQRVSRRGARRPDEFNRSVGFRCVADEGR
jgi:formylglycine-generating enzyme required for sulfatase activity